MERWCGSSSALCTVRLMWLLRRRVSRPSSSAAAPHPISTLPKSKSGSDKSGSSAASPSKDGRPRNENRPPQCGALWGAEDPLPRAEPPPRAVRPPEPPPASRVLYSRAPRWRVLFSRGLRSCGIFWCGLFPARRRKEPPTSAGRDGGLAPESAPCPCRPAGTPSSPSHPSSPCPSLPLSPPPVDRGRMLSPRPSVPRQSPPRRPRLPARA
mmetsp:Transcript_28765/g.91803  ORF Transcript_28765/g.91803 Transcript_28765/m.91803 type:complete len:211 (-) Transcript_28765:618-1250(-)